MSSDARIFLACLGLAMAAAVVAGCRYLPRERWQMLATVPIEKLSTGAFRGLNLTWYGALMASAVTLNAALVVVLLGTVGVPARDSLIFSGLTLAASMPAARLIARWVERKRHTFSASGSFLVGQLLAPAVISAMRGGWLGLPPSAIPAAPTLAALAAAAALGEALGRLACISFGCCYGKRLSDCSLPIRRLFASWHFVFRGATRKAVYEAHAEGEPLVPIQGVTAAVLSALGLGATALFLLGRHRAAFLTAAVGLQVWRVLSEVLRADDRGAGRFSAYQKMAIAGILLSVALALWIEPAAAAVDMRAGLRVLWDPAVLLLLQALWLAIFLVRGRSEVTTATVTFSVRRDRI